MAALTLGLACSTGCQYQIKRNRPQTALEARASPGANKPYWELDTSALRDRARGNAFTPGVSETQASSQLRRRAGSRPQSALSTLNYPRLSRPASKAQHEPGSKWGAALDQFKSYGAQGGALTRLMSAKGAREQPTRSHVRRPASAKMVAEWRQPGQTTQSAVGNHFGTLDKTSVLRMKVNLAFTQPTIPPPTPQLTGKAGTARLRNEYVENPPKTKTKTNMVEGNIENVPFA